MENKGLLHKQIVDFFVRNFDIRQEKEDDRETIESIKRGVEFKGTNLWVLIFATFIASLGLNMNSTAVIIGAMLISPLMGPIMGFGLGLGTFDFELIKRAFRNFATATVFGIITSTIYFLLTPIDEAQSELLARTQPTVYDVLIAFFGGLAGIVASSTKSKGNVIPGVAIATALMPPLCTAGFGLASGNLYYFFGALYLYFINTVFISLATFLVVRLLKYPKANPEQARHGYQRGESRGGGTDRADRAGREHRQRTCQDAQVRLEGRAPGGAPRLRPGGDRYQRIEEPADAGFI